MVVSINPEPSKQEFEKLLLTAVNILKEESRSSEKRYETLLGTKLEDEVVSIMSNCAVSTPFEGSIEKVSGQRFPDIIAKRFYGIEVKTTKSNHWKSTGSSIAEGTRVENVEKIYMLFGKMVSPIDFMCRPYEECLSEVVVTHSPRYLIDMNLKQGETIFDKIKIPYDELRKMSDPISMVLNYYRKHLKDTNGSTWWSPNGNDLGAKVVVRMWNQLDIKEQQYIRLKGLCLFPELISKDNFTKYNRFSVWLSTVESIICHNIRDIFSAGGQKNIEFEGNTYLTPKVIYHLIKNIEEIKAILATIDIVEIEQYWPNYKYADDMYSLWKNMIAYNYNERVGKFPLEKYLSNLELVLVR